MPHPTISAVSFDFFDTLATHRDGRGRGALVMEYFHAQGWASAPWEHAVLYDVLAAHGHEFAVTLGPAELQAFTGRVASTLFRRLDVQTDPALAAVHGQELWRILGPDHLAPFPETEPVVRQLRASGFSLAVISNWQCGLQAFCEALGFGRHFDIILASAEVGVAKPDVRIFETACRHLALPPSRILHVGDGRTSDVDGARAAGMQALWLCRGSDAADGPDVIRSLADVRTYLSTTG